MPKPFPDPNFNTTAGFFNHVNTVTDGWAAPLMCFVIPIVAFVLLKTKGYRTADSLSVSTFLGFLLSSLLWAAGVLAANWMMTLLFLSIAAFMLSVFTK